MIHFRLSLTPHAQGRPRTAVRGKIATIYKDSKSRTHEATVASMAAQYCPAVPLTGPLRVRLLVITLRPVGVNPISKRTGQPTGDLARYWNAKRSDVDNYAKAALDALSAFWVDDCQVVDLHAQKVVAAWGESPGFEVWIDAAGLEPGELADAVALAERIM